MSQQPHEFTRALGKVILQKKIRVHQRQCIGTKKLSIIAGQADNSGEKRKKKHTDITAE